MGAAGDEYGFRFGGSVQGAEVDEPFDAHFSTNPCQSPRAIHVRVVEGKVSEEIRIILEAYNSQLCASVNFCNSFGENQIKFESKS